ncbi:MULTISPECIES: hypothetical protein [Bacteria]|uniref:hypothetical protein n=1 Tax=Bacteria TaxID=2 RepID=UPI00111590A5|nr:MULTISPECIES: hypothetical protein [Klebsiella/Raoultella group]
MSAIFYDDFSNSYSPFAGKSINVAQGNMNREEIYLYSYATERDDTVNRKRFFKNMSLDRMLRHHSTDRHALQLIENYNSGDMKRVLHGDYFYLIESLISDSAVDLDCYTVSDMVDKIKKVFGLSTSNIAIIVGVSRATIYNHISCSSSVDVSEYQNLFHLAKAVEGRGYNISKGLKSVSVEGKTLLKHLTTEPFEFEKLIEICKIVSLKLKNMNTARAATIYDQKLTSIISNR